MTWEELQEKASELGLEYKESSLGQFIHKQIDFYKHIVFFKNGDVKLIFIGTDEYKISEKRTPDQMYAIMEALR